MIANRGVPFFMAYSLQFDFLKCIMECGFHLTGLAGGDQILTTAENIDLGDLAIFVFREDDVGAGTAVGNPVNAYHASFGKGLELWSNGSVASGVFHDHEAFSLQRERCGCTCKMRPNENRCAAS
jgi:hypothetical protein